ncbi:MAG TPA: hypothetical protein VNO21_11495, partial [Polyangiaceae bacterium]|nr:hypothetical protein [Polyangiaceae bacterium]
RTIMAQGLKQGIPMWVVASVAGVLALLLVGAIYVVFLGTSPGNRTAAAPAPTGLVERGGPGSAAAVAGPFGSAREAFNTAIAPAPKAAEPVILEDKIAPIVTASASAAPPAATSAPTNARAAIMAPAAIAKPDAGPEPIKRETATRGPTEIDAARVATGPTERKSTERRADKSEKTGLLTILCKPNPCNEGTDNGKPFDPSVPRQSVPAGEHRLVLKTSNPPVTKSQTVTVSAGDLTIQRVIMSP